MRMTSFRSTECLLLQEDDSLAGRHRGAGGRGTSLQFQRCDRCQGGHSEGEGDLEGEEVPGVCRSHNKTECRPTLGRLEHQRDMCAASGDREDCPRVRIR